jgi:hypothetical protein
MRTLLGLIFCAAATPTICAQQQAFYSGGRAPSCEINQAGPPACVGKPPCGPPICETPEQPVPKEGPPEQPYAPREMGSYVAPPRSGVTRGAATFKGLDFGTITLPELRLRMPCFELPHCFHGRSGARMQIDSAVAPWESQGFVNAAAPVGDRGAPPQQPESRGACSRAATERAACEEYTQKLRTYEDELRRLEDERTRLEDCIRKCLESNRGPAANLPRGDLDCTRADRSAPPRKDDRSFPYRSPVQVPTPLPEEGARQIPVQPLPRYGEQPAAFISEPARLAPPDGVIREPAPPAVRITGLRPALP